MMLAIPTSRKMHTFLAMPLKPTSLDSSLRIPAARGSHQSLRRTSRENHPVPQKQTGACRLHSAYFVPCLSCPFPGIKNRTVLRPCVMVFYINTAVWLWGIKWRSAYEQDWLRSARVRWGLDAHRLRYTPLSPWHFSDSSQRSSHPAPQSRTHRVPHRR